MQLYDVIYSVSRPQWVNSLARERFQFNFKLILVNGGWSISHEIALRWMPLDLTDDKSTLVQVMAWCRQATSHYLSQCWHISVSPNGITKPRWLNLGLPPSLSGIMNMAGAIPGFVGVYIAGHLLKVTHSWTLVFNQTAFVSFVGYVIFMYFGTGKQIV